MARFTYAISAVLALSGILVAIGGINAREFQPVASGFTLLCGAFVFALLYIGTRRKSTPPVTPAVRPQDTDGA